MLMACDISLSTGIAWGGPGDGRPRTALWRLPEGEHNLDRALVMLRESVAMICRFEKIEIVCIEAAMRKIDKKHGATPAFTLISLSAVAREAASKTGCRVVPVSAQTWRADRLGNGNMSGEDAKRMCREFCTRMGWPFQNTDVAEANLIWSWGMARFYPKWNPLQFKVPA